MYIPYPIRDLVILVVVAIVWAAFLQFLAPDWFFPDWLFPC